MESFYDLSHEEMLKLTDAEIENWAKVECAAKGVKMLPKPEKVERKFFEKTKETYRIPNFNILTTTKKSAEEIAAVLGKHSNEIVEEKYDYRVGYEYKYVRPKDYAGSIDIDKVMYFEEEAIRKNEDFLMKSSKADERYRHEINEYDKSREAIIQVKNNIYDRYYMAKEFEERVTKHKKIYAEYEAITKGDKAMAVEFYKKAHGEVVNDQELVARLEFLNGQTGQVVCDRAPESSNGIPEARNECPEL